MSLFIGTCGFIMYFIYDFNSVWKPQSWARYFFTLGSVLVAGSLLLEIWQQRVFISINSWFYIFLFLSFVFLALLIYTLFFCFDVDEAYVKISTKRTAYTQGMYALCRHPGVIWFILGFYCLYGMIPESHVLLYVSLMSLYNILYIVLQDVYVFPRTFDNYSDYQKTTPFLIPNKQSMLKCIKTWSKENEYDS